MVDKPTDAEIQRVKQWQCDTEGHDYEIVTTVGRNAPSAIVCTRCGETWDQWTTVTEDDVRVAIGDGLSILRRIAGPYELYGGVEVRKTIKVLEEFLALPPRGRKP